ncbi:MAG TPA: DUF2075 domain-containing protein [Gammaproteobacteria bacterium]|nr:DUF2075 domain-containing protein [Gammaproteobacteria bacterium]
MNYFEFFGLREHPFQVTPDSRFLYLSDAHAKAKSYMDYSVWKRDGFVVITGDVGAGKTTLIHKLLSEIDANAIVIRIFQTQLNEIEFLQTMLSELGFDEEACRSTSKVDILHRLKTYLLEAARRGRHVVLLVDEAQNLSRAVLEEIRMLSTPDPGGEQVLNIILVGQPELRDALDQPDLEQLAQRIRLRFHVGPLDERETREYVNHRLKVAGLEREGLFDDEALAEVYRYSGGIPRRINILCDTALICAFADETDSITRTTIDEAVDELQWKPHEPPAPEPAASATDDQASATQRLRPWLSQAPAQVQQAGAASEPEDGRDKPMQGPAFSGGEQEWARLFSLVLNTLSDMSSRMARLEAAIDRLLAQDKPAEPAGARVEPVPKPGSLSVVAPSAQDEREEDDESTVNQ